MFTAPCGVALRVPLTRTSTMSGTSMFCPSPSGRDAEPKNVLGDSRIAGTAYAHGSGRESLPPDVEVEVRAGERVECSPYVPAGGATT